MLFNLFFFIDLQNLRVLSRKQPPVMDNKNWQLLTLTIHSYWRIYYITGILNIDVWKGGEQAV